MQTSEAAGLANEKGNFDSRMSVVERKSVAGVGNKLRLMSAG